MSEEMTPTVEPSTEEQLAKELVERARSEGAQLVGPGGLLTDLTKTEPLRESCRLQSLRGWSHVKHIEEVRAGGS